MDYVVAVQAPAYALSPRTFATESAFAEHLKELRRTIGPKFSRVVLISPQMIEQEYALQKEHLGIVSAEVDEVEYVAAQSTTTSPFRFWVSHALPLWRKIRRAVKDAGLVHSGMSTDVKRPLMAMVNLAAWIARRPVVFYVDIDFRQHSHRSYRTGAWGLKSYLVNRILYDPLKWIQVWLAPRMFPLVLLKSASMVSDFGDGRPNVKNFYDTAHSAEHVLTESELPRRLEWIRDTSRPLQVVYFGRFVSNKGLDKAIEAVRLARQLGEDVRLTLIGGGECLAALMRQAENAGMGSAIAFKPQVRYGAALFDQLNEAHVSIAAPLIEDTPRSAFDSMARGIPVVAFDITYFRDLARESGAVALAEWPSVEALARELIALSRGREKLADMAKNAVTFARENTQAIWLQRRAHWTMDLALGERAAA